MPNRPSAPPIRLRSLLAPLTLISCSAAGEPDPAQRSADVHGAQPPSDVAASDGDVPAERLKSPSFEEPSDVAGPELDVVSDPPDMAAIDPSAIRLTELHVGGMVFDAREAGPVDGELVVLLHGFPQTSYCWRHALSSLGALGYHAVAPDLRGYSPRARPTAVEDYAIDLLIGDVLGMVEQTGADRFHIVGHDWGGVIAWKLAAERPDRLSSLSVVSTPHTDALRAAEQDPSSAQATRSAALDQFTGPNGADILVAGNGAPLRLMYTGVDAADVDVYIAAVGHRDGIDAALNYRRANGIGKIATGPIFVDTLYVYGDADPAFLPDAAARTAEFVQADYRFENLAGVNHWVPDIAPDAVTVRLIEHVTAHSEQ